MSIRLNPLTTDAVPDPPRIPSEDITRNSEEAQSKAPSNNDANSPKDTAFRSESPVDERPTPNSAERSNTKNKSSKAKAKSQTSKSANIVNVNIVKCNNVKIGARRSYVCNINQYGSTGTASPNEFSNKPREKPMSIRVKALSSSIQEISKDDMFLIKTHIGHGWKDVARKIGYSEGQIEQFVENYKDVGVGQVIYQILLDWKQAYTKDAQIGILVCAMWSSQEYDCAERLAKMYESPST